MYVRRIAFSTRDEPDWSGRCTCSHTASHSAIAAITGLAEVLRVRAREADALDPVDGVARAEQLAELGVDARAAGRAPTS